MAYNARSNYQYETSPKKLQPEYKPNRKQVEQTKAKKVTTSKNVKNKVRKKAKLNTKGQITLYVIVGFFALFALCYRN